MWLNNNQLQHKLPSKHHHQPQNDTIGLLSHRIKRKSRNLWPETRSQRKSLRKESDRCWVPNKRKRHLCDIVFTLPATYHAVVFWPSWLRLELAKMSHADVQHACLQVKDLRREGETRYNEELRRKAKHSMSRANLVKSNCNHQYIAAAAVRS